MRCSLKHLEHQHIRKAVETGTDQAGLLCLRRLSPQLKLRAAVTGSRRERNTMIDFVSTRSTTDVQTAACARLLAAVIAQAIRDAAQPFREKDRSKDLAMSSAEIEAREAVRFLFGGGSAFPLYASLIGSSAEAIRHALLNSPDDLVKVPGRGLSDAERRLLRHRLRMCGVAAHPFEQLQSA